MFRAEEPAQVIFPTKGPAMVKFWQLALAVIVTVYAIAFEAVSKTTSSVGEGTLAPPPPPEVADQFVVVLPSQFPVPPTQYLVAILS